MIYQPMSLKRCTRCGEWFLPTPVLFKTNRGRLAQPCRNCDRDYGRRYSQSHPLEKKERNKEYYAQHAPEERDRSRQYYRGHRMRVIRRVMQYSATRKESRRIWSRGYYKSHGEQKRHNNRMSDHRRRAIIRNLPGSFSVRDWKRCLRYWGFCCAVCGRPKGLWHKIATDHWIPLTDVARCPGTVPTNIIPLCHGVDGCNNSKSNRDPVEWLIKRLGNKAGKKKLAEIEAYFDSLRSTGATEPQNGKSTENGSGDHF